MRDSSEASFSGVHWYSHPVCCWLLKMEELVGIWGGAREGPGAFPVCLDTQTCYFLEQVFISSPVPCFRFLLSLLLFFLFSFFFSSFLLPGPGLGNQDSEMTQSQSLFSERSPYNEENRIRPSNYNIVCWVLWLSYLCTLNTCWIKKEQKWMTVRAWGGRHSQGDRHGGSGTWAAFEKLVIITSTC